MTAPTEGGALAGGADLSALRRWLHQHPQTGFGVEATADAVAEQLEGAGLQVTRHVGGSGVVATLRRGTADRSIGLRADLDALPIEEANVFDHRSQSPRAFHGCGHDGRVAMLVGAARSLAERDDLDGQVHFIFQPDEENGRGAQAMIDDGLFERFPMDAVYGLRNLPGLPVGTFATQAGTFTAYTGGWASPRTSPSSSSTGPAASC